MNPIAPLKILKASAGSGKTFSLTIHYLTLLLSNENNYREILAVTFTNKATAEMKERILQVLKGLATGNTSTKIEDYRRLLLEAFPQWSEQDLQQRGQHVYRRILHDYSHFTVSTIDGFSQKVIRNFTYELNLDAAYKIEMNTNKVKQDLTVMLNQLLDDRPDLLNWIIAYAEKKIANNENWNYRQQLMSLAGLIFSENFQEFDGSLHAADAHEVFNLLNKEVSEMTQNFLQTLSSAITAFNSAFTKAGVIAEDMKRKSRNALISASRSSPDIGKLSVSELQKTLDKFVSLLDNEEDFTDQSKQVRYDLVQLFQPVLQTFDELNKLFPTFIAYQAVQQNLYFLRLLKEMSDLLSQWRKENGAQLISDSQILLNRLGLDNNNDPTFIWEKIGNRYNYFLFDEFQDTSRIQWKNYSPLLVNALANSSQKINEHLIVGDVKQSIYRWRNGDWRILLHQVEDQIKQAFHLQEQNQDQFINNDTLETNFRSLPNIIAFNNYIYSQLPQKIQQVLNEKIEVADTGWWHSSGNDRMLLEAYENSKQTTPVSKLGAGKPLGEIDIHYFPVEDGRYRRNQVFEASTEALCQQIGEWISSGKYQPKQVGILVRTNKQAQTVIHALMDYKNKKRLNFDIISGEALSLNTNDAVQLLIETLKAIVYEPKEYAIYKANMAYLYNIIQHNRSFEQSTWLQFKDNNIQQLKNVLPHELVENWSQWQRLPLIHLIEKLIELYQLTTENNIHIPYLLAFKDIVAKFSADGERGILHFLQYWEEDGNKAVLPSGGQINAIEVTTIHKSKGLAYDVVMIPFCSWDLDGMHGGDFWIDTSNTPFDTLGKIPVKYYNTLGKSIFDRQYYEEMLFNYMDALNTLYVATTRAISHLYISAPYFKESVDKKSGQTLPDIKSEYISDVLYQVLQESENAFRINHTELHIPDAQAIHPPTEQIPTENSISIRSYPISEELDQALSKSSKRSLSTILTVEKAAQYGILAHEILSEVTTEKEIQTLIERYIEEGILAKANQEELLRHIYQVWHHPQISQWLNGNYKIWNEASIITANGETIRPDKVFTSPDETIVLDFKFTQHDYIGHKAQVDQYREALKNLGYQHVKGYLYYAKSNVLQVVE